MALVVEVVLHSQTQKSGSCMWVSWCTANTLSLWFCIISDVTHDTVRSCCIIKIIIFDSCYALKLWYKTLRGELYASWYMYELKAKRNKGMKNAGHGSNPDAAIGFAPAAPWQMNHQGRLNEPAGIIPISLHHELDLSQEYPPKLRPPTLGSLISTLTWDRQPQG